MVSFWGLQIVSRSEGLVEVVVFILATLTLVLVLPWGPLGPQKQAWQTEQPGAVEIRPIWFSPSTIRACISNKFQDAWFDKVPARRKWLVDAGLQCV